MLKFDYDDDNHIEIHFDHKWLAPFEVESLTGGDVEENRRCFMAIIYRNGIVIGNGVAVCNPVDNFCRAHGRKIALTNALYQLNKPLRTVIWKEYLSKCRVC